MAGRRPTAMPGCRWSTPIGRTLERTDFAAFRPLAALPMGMTAHVVFTAIDPVAPATISATIVRDVICDSIGFQGLLMSDDISMGALEGSIAERSRAAIAAGCDLVLHCNGDMAEMMSVAAEAPVLAGEAARRAAAALAAQASRRSRSTRSRAAASSANWWPAAWQPAQGKRMMPDDFQFVAEFPERATDEPALVVDVEGFEGPLDLLLTLARQQKVDLAKISILALADQYLAFIEAARKFRLELAADYLVMAAWLAYLKSRLLLPEPHEPDGHERRGHGDRARAPPAPARGHPRVSPSNCSTGRNWTATFSRAASRSRSPRSNSRNGRRRCTTCSRPMPGSVSAGALVRAHAQAHGVVAGRSARRAGAADRPRGRLVRARRISDRLHGRTVARRRRFAPRVLQPRWNWCGKARWNCIRKRRLRRSISVSGGTQGERGGCGGTGKSMRGKPE